MGTVSGAVADQLADRRRELGLTLEEVGERAGMHRTSIGLVERHMRTLTLDAAHRLCAALDLRLSDLVRVAEDAEGV